MLPSIMHTSVWHSETYKSKNPYNIDLFSLSGKSDFGSDKQLKKKTLVPMTLK
jgi:hypothetical protein